MLGTIDIFILAAQKRRPTYQFKIYLHYVRTQSFGVLSLVKTRFPYELNTTCHDADPWIMKFVIGVTYAFRLMRIIEIKRSLDRVT